MMTRIVILIVVTALAVTTFLLIRSQPAATVSSTAASQPEEPKTTRSSGAEPTTVRLPPSTPKPAPLSDAVDEIAQALPAARDGKGDAQFKLYELLAGCKDEYPMYFSKGPRLLDPSEASVRADALRSIDEYAVDVYEMCHRLMNEQPALLSQADQWFEKALAQRQPKALTVQAVRLLNSSRESREGRALLGEAVTTGDAYALWLLGEVQPLLGGSADDTNKERWAMQLASCNRGFDCRPESKWVKRYCKADPASLCPINANAEEMIRSKTGSDFEMIKIRAKEINALIDAGKGAELVPQSP